METSAASAAREIAPLLSGMREETERDRRLSQPIVQRLVESRLSRIAIARQHGGLALPVDEALEVYEVLAAAEASAAWIVWNNQLPCFFSRYLAPAARAEVLVDASWLYASSTRPTGQASGQGDGYRVSGRWSLVSGCELAEWVLLACVVHEDGAPRMGAPGEPEIRFAYLRRGSFEILDTWHVGGMRGTGSHDVVATDVPVPAALTFSPGDKPTLDEPIGRVPMICTMSAGFAAQTLGMADAALRTLAALAHTKANVEAGPGLRDRAPVQVFVARQTAALEAARGHLRRRTRELWDAAEAGLHASPEQIGAVWAASHHAVDVAGTTLDGAYSAAGTSALYTTCPLERQHRDLHAMLAHVVAQPIWLEDAGKVKLGMAPTHPLFGL
jgi:alkylation response protein AidB-like acyl-CoA dehydrogenase